MTLKMRKPLEEIHRYLQAGMSLADASRVTGYPVSALSIMAAVWDIKLKRGKPKGYKRVGNEN
jgi:hypothetical protein